MSYSFKIIVFYLIVTTTICYSAEKDFIELSYFKYVVPSQKGELLKVEDVVVLDNWRTVHAENYIPNSKNADYLWIKIENFDSVSSFNTMYFGKYLNNYEIYHNNKLIKVRTSKKESAEFLNIMQQNLIDLTNIKNGDKLFIKLYTSGKSKILIPSITIGESADIIKFIMLRNMPNIIITVFVIISALLTLLFFIILERRKIILGLFIFLISIGIWISVNSAIVQILFNNPIHLFYLNFISFQITGTAFFFILSEIVNKKYCEIINFIWKSKVLILLISFFLIFNSPDITKITLQSVLFINMIFLLIGLTTVSFSMKNNNKSKKVILYGMILIMIASFIQIGIIFINLENANNTSIIDIGALFFIASIIWLGILNYIESQKEKEKIKEIEFETIKRENEASFLFSSRLIESQENERNRIALELHDSIGQKLLLIKNQVLSRIRNVNSKEDKEIFEKISNLSDETISEIRSITHNLRPQYLDQLGLSVAIESIVEKITELSAIEITQDIDDVINRLIPTNDQINFFRIIQESLSNLVKHSGADEVFLRIKKESDMIILEIRDNGIGFIGIENKAGTGLTGMKERAKMLGADLEISSNEKGTKITMNYPIKLIKSEYE